MPVTVQYFKYPDLLHWRHDTTRLGEDEFGVWLAIPTGTTVQRGHEPERLMDRDAVQLVAADRWWSLIYNGPEHEFEVYVDITTPAVWERADRVTMFDLDLDVVRHQDGTVEILDEDEFDEHRHARSYPPQLVDGARAATAAIFVALERHEEPFGTVAATWLGRLTER